MAFFLSPVLNEQQFDANGDPRAGALISTYLAGTLTAVTTYKTSTGTAHTNPIQLDSSGNYPNGTQLWLLGGFAYKFVITDSTGANSRTFDNITGVGDDLSGIDQWIVYSAAPTYISATSFSLVGDQTNTFQVGRRIRTINAGGTIYSTITASSFAAGITTVTVVNDSGVLDASLSQVSYGLLSATNPSIPQIITAGVGISVAYTSGAPAVSSSTARGYLFGLTLSNNVADATNDIDIATGAATDSTGAYVLSLTGPFTKRLDAAWAVGSGNGGLDTGAIANTTYHVWLIRKDSDGSIDALFSTSATAPTMPAGYTYKAFVGSIIRASAAILPFVQVGDEVLWKASALDFDSGANTTSSSVVIRAPLGIQTLASVQVIYNNSVAGNFVLYVSSTDQNDETASLAAARATVVNPSTTVFGASTVSVRTNTSAQIRIRSDDANNTTRISTRGFTYIR